MPTIAADLQHPKSAPRPSAAKPLTRDTSPVIFAPSQFSAMPPRVLKLGTAGRPASPADLRASNAHLALSLEALFQRTGRRSPSTPSQASCHAARILELGAVAGELAADLRAAQSVHRALGLEAFVQEHAADLRASQKVVIARLTRLAAAAIKKRRQLLKADAKLQIAEPEHLRLKGRMPSASGWHRPCACRYGWPHMAAPEPKSEWTSCRASPSRCRLR